jgi:hypothetical protein
MRALSAMFGRLAPALYCLGAGLLVLTHLYAAVLAYQYVTAWRSGRVILWVFVTLILPVLSTLYWLVVHWLQSGIFWNWLTLACAAGLACIVVGMLCELLERRAAG